MPFTSHTAYRPSTPSAQSQPRPELTLLVLLLLFLLSGCNAGKGVTILSSGAGSDNVAQAQDSTRAEPRPQLQPKGEPPTRRLTWDAPLSREDGTSLYPGEIDGYRIYYKLKRGGDEFQSISLDDPMNTSLSLADFAPGLYQFAISTVDIDGLESRRSAVVQVDVFHRPG